MNMHPNHPDGDDGLNAARGIINTLLLSIPIWILFTALAYLAWQAQQ